MARRTRARPLWPRHRQRRIAGKRGRKFTNWPWNNRRSGAAASSVPRMSGGMVLQGFLLCSLEIPMNLLSSVPLILNRILAMYSSEISHLYRKRKRRVWCPRSPGWCARSSGGASLGKGSWDGGWMDLPPLNPRFKYRTQLIIYSISPVPTKRMYRIFWTMFQTPS